MSEWQFLSYIIIIVLSPFVGIILAYLLFKKNNEIGLIMVTSAFISMGVFSLVLPLYFMITN
ncbi:hypothetical protein [Priestia megaterium]|uniref:hypothetical protein n=1 Tax=Priestia megaterium TaxID=1404 RepID=UPI00287727CD|nr:hypothetical protein [Priestia megaterium]